MSSDKKRSSPCISGKGLPQLNLLILFLVYCGVWSLKACSRIVPLNKSTRAVIYIDNDDKYMILTISFFITAQGH